MHFKTLFSGGASDKKKNSPAKARDVRDACSIPGLARSLKEGMAAHSSILAWRIPWTEEPGGYRPWNQKESDVTGAI